MASPLRTRSTWTVSIVILAAGLVPPVFAGSENGDERRPNEDADRARQRLLEAEQAGGDLDAEIDRHYDRIHILRRQQLDLQLAIQQMLNSDQPESAKSLEADMMQLEYELQRNEIDLQRLTADRDRVREQREIIRMTDRLDYVTGWRDVAYDAPRAVVMATQAVVELHVGAGDPAAAADRLSEVLKRIDGRGARTAIRFALKDIYAELGRIDAASEQMIEVIAENAGKIERPLTPPR